MYFHKIPTPYNFSFSKNDESTFILEELGGDVFRLSVTNLQRWPKGSYSQAVLDDQVFSREDSRVKGAVTADGQVRLTLQGEVVLEGLADQAFGVNGSQWMVCFPLDGDEGFFGMGEKQGFERSGVRTQFWNTDVFGDFSMKEVESGRTDPMYVSLPVLIRRKIVDGYIRYTGLVVNNPCAPFMNTGAEEGIFAFQNIQPDPLWYVGAQDGEPEIYVIVDETMAGVVSKIQRLQGCTPLPPLWALGHHQCRWGYKSQEQLEQVAQGYIRHGIPNDGLWLDIEYMRGYRVFTLEEQGFPGGSDAIQGLSNQGNRIIPILDPGIKRDETWDVYRDGVSRNIFCKTQEDLDYVGFVWPGITVFPDFSLPEVRHWWADQVKKFTGLGFSGYWIDMNDPSTGSSPLEDMRFNHGADNHMTYHNQYALGMAQATRAGLELAHPGMRPFVLSRSAFLSSSRYSAVWTGDNVSNDHHLSGTIAISLSLSISGIPFNGPDVPGFAGDASAELMRAWYKAGFLFPFFRNHNVLSSADQEPWTRDSLTLEVVGEYIKSRYRLLPYLYSLFVHHEKTGEPIMRPMVYHETPGDSAGFDLTTLDNQYYLGFWIFHAPILTSRDTERSVRIPTGAWYSILSGSWISGPRQVSVKTTVHTTPLFFRENAVIPLRSPEEDDRSPRIDLTSITLLFVPRAGREGDPPSDRPGESLVYHADDGESQDYLQGDHSEFQVGGYIRPDGVPALRISRISSGFGPVRVFPKLVGHWSALEVVVDGISHSYPLTRGVVSLAGVEVAVSHIGNDPVVV